MEHEYNPLAAAAVTFSALPASIRAGLSEADVLEMLELEFRYYQGLLAGGQIPAPERYGAAALADWILTAPRRSGQPFTAEQVAHVLAAEEVYLRAIGLMPPGRGAG